MANNKLTLLNNAKLMPLIGSMDSFTAGIYTKDNQFVHDSLIHRGKQSDLFEIITYLDGTYIFGGYLFAHFGHFIWESLSRLYAICQCKDYPILFLTPSSKLHHPFQVLFDSIKLKNSIYLVKQPTSVEKLIFAQAGSSLEPLYITDSQIESLVRFDFKNSIMDKKIWLSRSKLQYGMIINENEIEEQLRFNGFEIVYPEYISLHEQVRLISTSRIVAGFDGSAFYSSLFSRRINGEFFIFNRRENIPEALIYALEKKAVKFHTNHLEIHHISGDGGGANAEASNPKDIVAILSEV